MIRQSDIDILIAEGEGSTLEYKEGLSAGLARELVAFANSAGGKILLGVRDDGGVVGIRDSNDLRARIQDMARNCDPPVKVLVESVGETLVVTVRESESKPVQCKDGFFWRQGASTQKLTRDEIREFFQGEGAVRFDTALCPSFRYPEDFDQEKFDRWLRRTNISAGANVEDILLNTEAAKRDGKRLIFKNGAVLFFATKVRHFFTQAYITCLLGKGRDKVHILDRKDFEGGIVDNIEDAMRFIERNTRLAYKIEKLQREEIPEYPMAALREAVTNAVMHRDYFQAGANVFVEVYSDRIEVSNPGGLPKGLDLNELGTRSVRRNTLISDLLHRIGFIEKAGTGIRRMREGAVAHGCEEPVFKGGSFFSATFWPLPSEQEPSVVASKIPATTPSAVTVPVTVPVAVPVAVPVREVLELAQRPHSRAELQRAAGLANKAHFLAKYLQPLLAAGWLEMTIPDKPRSSKQQYRTTAAGLKALEDSEL